MPDSNVPDLTNVTSLAGTDEFYVVTSSGTLDRGITHTALSGALHSATVTHQTDAASSQLLDLVGPNRATPAEDDEIYQSFTLEATDGNIEAGRFTVALSDVGSGTEASSLFIDLLGGGSLFETFQLIHTSSASTFTIIDTGASDNLEILVSSTTNRAQIRSASGLTSGLVVDSAAGPIDLQATTTTQVTHQVDEASAQVFSLIGPNRATPADNDEVYVSFTLEDSAANDEFARISAVALDVTTTEEDGAFTFDVVVAGTDTEALRIESDLSSGTRLSMSNDCLIARDVNAGLTASTTQTQGQGALTAEVNEVSTVANANDTVTLPSAVAGLKIVIINNGANTLQIFPASGDDAGGGVDTAITLAVGSNLVKCAYDATTWETI